MISVVLLLIVYVVVIYLVLNRGIMARELFCIECRDWHPVSKETGITCCRRAPASEHLAAAALFNSDELMELDAMLNGFYGELL